MVDYRSRIRLFGTYNLDQDVSGLPLEIGTVVWARHDVATKIIFFDQKINSQHSRHYWTTGKNVSVTMRETHRVHIVTKTVDYCSACRQ
jgi:hypothetical protein